LNKIAVLMTCHNRKLQTLESLAALFQSDLPSDCCLDVFLVDDGSSDGTEGAVRHDYPQVNVIKGDGNLYWNGGMRIAFSAAMDEGYDYYLWLNDDTVLFHDAIQMMLFLENEIKKQDGKPAIIVGSTCASHTEKRTYGGLVLFNEKKPLSFLPINSSDEFVMCDAFEGNCVLIPKVVAQAVGNLSPEYSHAIGDMDYGLRAKSLGVSLVVSPGYVGVCDVGSVPVWCDKDVALRARVSAFLSPKGLPPKEWYTFTRRHAGVFWFIHWLKPSVRVLFPWLWN